MITSLCLVQIWMHSPSRRGQCYPNLTYWISSQTPLWFHICSIWLSALFFFLIIFLPYLPLNFPIPLGMALFPLFEVSFASLFFNSSCSHLWGSYLVSLASLSVPWFFNRFRGSGLASLIGVCPSSLVGPISQGLGYAPGNSPLGG